MKSVIVGYGVVGKNIHKEFPEAAIVDPFQGYPYTDTHYDVAFISVPTDMQEEGACNTKIVLDAILQIDAECIIIKSTIPPETTRIFQELTDKKLSFSPEFYGGTQHANGVDYDFTIIGEAKPGNSIRARELYKAHKPASYYLRITDSTTAELVKYAENSFLATKVTFFNEFYRAADKIHVDIDEFRELLLLDPRIGRSHTFTYRDHPYYQSHCLDKDVPAIIHSMKTVHACPMPLLEAVVSTNKKYMEDPLGRAAVGNKTKKEN